MEGFVLCFIELKPRISLSPVLKVNIDEIIPNNPRGIRQGVVGLLVIEEPVLQVAAEQGSQDEKFLRYPRLGLYRIGQQFVVARMVEQPHVEAPFPWVDIQDGGEVAHLILPVPVGWLL